LPPELPRTEIRHEPHDVNCPCGCRLKFVRNEVTEKLDYTPGTFTVERHVRPFLACPSIVRKGSLSGWGRAGRAQKQKPNGKPLG
jgi:transposase